MTGPTHSFQAESEAAPCRDVTPRFAYILCWGPKFLRGQTFHFRKGEL